MGKYITEFIGTFFLVLVVALTGNAAAIGVVLMVMIFAGGHISGGHYNPAVTLAVLIRGKVTPYDAGIYIIVQLLAAVVAALVAMWFVGDVGVATLDLSGKELKAFVSELLGTFALAYVVLNVATSKGTTGNSFYGLAIGATVFTMASTFGGVSGGAFNPAVALGATVIKAFAWKNIWIYLIACFGGGLCAALLFKYINVEDRPMPPLKA
jgi:aquaporin Z